jgi:Putative adhesin
VKRSRVLLPLVLLLAACSSPTPYSSTVGIMQPGMTLTIEAKQATINGYKPAVGEPSSRFTLEPTALASGTPPPIPTSLRARNGLIIAAPYPLRSLLVRVPDRVNLVVHDKKGDVNVTDITGNADAHTADGNVQIMLPGYAQASTGNGRLSVTMGSTDWPGTLHFTNRNGDIEVWINTTAQFTVRLHTDDGTIFTDFNLRGTSKGSAETIDGPVNGGGPRRVDIEAHHGAIRLLQLRPQA